MRDNEEGAIFEEMMVKYSPKTGETQKPNSFKMLNKLQAG